MDIRTVAKAALLHSAAVDREVLMQAVLLRHRTRVQVVAAQEANTIQAPPDIMGAAEDHLVVMLTQ